MQNEKVDYNTVVPDFLADCILRLLAMPDASHRIAHDILMGFADNPDIRPDDQRAYRLIAPLVAGKTLLRKTNSRALKSLPAAPLDY